jgi:hypothetical protein
MCIIGYAVSYDVTCSLKMIHIFCMQSHVPFFEQSFELYFAEAYLWASRKERTDLCRQQ